MRGPATGEASDADGRRVILLRNLAIAAAAGVFLALVGAFETTVVPVGPRLLYWVPIMMAGGLLGHAMAALILRIPRAATNIWIFAAILAVAIAVPATFVVWGWTAVFFPAIRRFDVLPEFALNVLLISLAMTAITTIANRPGRVTHAPPAGRLCKFASSNDCRRSSKARRCTPSQPKTIISASTPPRAATSSSCA